MIVFVDGRKHAKCFIECLNAVHLLITVWLMIGRVKTFFAASKQEILSKQL